jgi:hypothetical protein
MTRFFFIVCAAVLAQFPVIVLRPAQDKDSLHLVQSIPMPNVKGRIDPMDVDVDSKF